MNKRKRVNFNKKCVKLKLPKMVRSQSIYCVVGWVVKSIKCFLINSIFIWLRFHIFKFIFISWVTTNTIKRSSSSVSASVGVEIKITLQMTTLSCIFFGAASSWVCVGLNWRLYYGKLIYIIIKFDLHNLSKLRQNLWQIYLLL